MGKINIWKIFSFLANRGLFNSMNDKTYLTYFYRAMTGEKLKLENPVNFNEKLQWLKINNRKDIYTVMVDKYEVKGYVANLIGSEHIIPTIGVYDKFDDINPEKLPNQFVIKCTHDSGGLEICKDKSTFDWSKAKNKIEKSLKRNYYYSCREWPYKNVKPRIIIEKYMEDESKTELKDYKIFCFNGIPKMIMVDSGRFSNHVRNVYDTDWNNIDISINFPNSKNLIVKKPSCLDKLLKFSKLLSKDIPFIRVDFYVINNDIYFGELTFYPGGGFQKIMPEKWQKELGDMIDLNLVKKDEK